MRPSKVAIFFSSSAWPHQSLGGKTPALAARLEDHVCAVDELIALRLPQDPRTQGGTPWRDFKLSHYHRTFRSLVLPRAPRQSARLEAS